jgi:hypothetical protein
MNTTTVTSYIVLGRVPGKPWLELGAVTEAVDEPGDVASTLYKSWAAARGHLDIQLVKRTAVITDEVLVQGTQGQE